MSAPNFERRNPLWVTPEYEDAGLFRTGLSRVQVDLIPDLWQNTRGDIVVRGFVGGRLAMCVVFAGRRKSEARPLLARLRTMQARATFARVAPDGPNQSPSWQRVPVVIEGAWRRVMEEDDEGWPIRHYHLMAAQWSPIDPAADGGNADEGAQYGIAPAIFE